MTLAPEVSTDRQSVHRRIQDQWFRLLIGGTILILAVSTIGKLLADPLYINRDSALFQHAGWFILEGATPYVDFWDLKPPLIYAVTTFLAVLSGGNMVVQHLLGIFIAVGTVASGVVLVGVLVHDLTDDGVASLTAAATMFVIPSVHGFPAAGIRPKYFAFLFGTAALLLVIRERPIASGAAAAIGAGFWQLGGLIAILVVGMSLQRLGPRAALKTIGGGVLVTAIVVLPLVAGGLGIPLLVEVVIAPVYGVEQYSTLGRFFEIILELGYGVLLLPLGAAGWLWAVLDDYRAYWWVLGGGIAYTLQLFLEFQGAIEAILLLVFLAIGVGLLTTRLRAPQHRLGVAGGLVMLGLLTIYWTSGPITPIHDAVAAAYQAHAVPAYPELPPDPDGIPSMQTIYWEQLQPEECHYRLGHKQKYFAHVTGESLTKSQCGQWPFAEPPGQWVWERLRPW